MLANTVPPFGMYMSSYVSSAVVQCGAPSGATGLHLDKVMGILLRISGGNLEPKCLVDDSHDIWQGFRVIEVRKSFGTYHIFNVCLCLPHNIWIMKHGHWDFEVRRQVFKLSPNEVHTEKNLQDSNSLECSANHHLSNVWKKIHTGPIPALRGVDRA